MLKVGGVKNVRKFVVIGVSAETSPDMMEFRSDQVPVLSKAMSSLVDVPINRYSFDTLTLLGLGVEDWKRELRESRRAADSPFAQDAEIYFINASLSEIPDAAERAALMKIPTTLSLTDEQIDRLLIAASRLIHNNPDFQRLMQDIEAGR
jgi:NTE family protein